ncbi:MAG: fumarylacetoacetate hydrolase family protein [Dyella sp.]
MSYIVNPPAVRSLPIIGGSQRFPVRRVFCIGRNYADHAREMGSTVDRETPIFFMKPADAIVSDGGDVAYPPQTKELHHEVEMVLALGSGGHELNLEQAQAAIWGYGVGLDLTRRDVQALMKEKRYPWDVAKAFDQSAPVSALRAASEMTPGADTVIKLSVNGQVRQQGLLGDMIFSGAEIIALLSQQFLLKPGDLIFTGTPAGVAALERGDRFQAELVGITSFGGRVV